MAGFIDRARSDGASLVVFPELALCGYPPRDLLLCEGFIPACVHAAKRLGERHTAGLTAVFGCPLHIDQERPHHGTANSLLVYADGRYLDYHDKRLLPTYDVFDEDRYFDVFVEYAKATPEDLLVRIEVHNRGPEAAELHLLPTLWLRNTWSWNGGERPSLRELPATPKRRVVEAVEARLGRRHLYCAAAARLLFTENETNTQRLFGAPNRTPYVKDAFHELVVHGRADAVNPQGQGTKVAAYHRSTVPAGGSWSVALRLSELGPEAMNDPFGPAFEEALRARRAEADAFYAEVIPARVGEDGARVMRQALAGMLWSKQFYHYDVERWLEERGADPLDPARRAAPRNDDWHHMYNGDVISMPDKWEYPWYAAWDLAFHVPALTLVDPDLGKDQLRLMLSEQYLHPNGQIPAYEWNFGDVNPPVHAWATIFTYRLEAAQTGKGDREWLKRCFQKLLLNFAWWVNRKDVTGRNVFGGGFLGLDNIGVFDRSAPLPTGGHLEQADGTAWMALFCENMLDIAGELAQTDPEYVDMAMKFVQHFLWIAASLTRVGETGMWDEEDGFFYDVLRSPDGRAQRLKVRSVVGLLPLCAATVFEGRLLRTHPEHRERLARFLQARPELTRNIHDPTRPGLGGRLLASILDEGKLRRVLARMLDEREFLGPYGIRSLSRVHAEHPFVLRAGGQEFRVAYLPAESDSGMFGGNSNWRGPVWAPINALIIRALLQYYAYYGDEVRVECPTGSGRLMTLYEVAEELGRRMASIFLRDAQGRRPVFGGARKFQEDPRWRDHLLFYEYFHGDDGAGLGASHQTGWTGIVARAMHMFATMSAEAVRVRGKMAPVDATELTEEERVAAEARLAAAMRAARAGGP
ncbi:MAG: glucosidase [Planctomycetota bacterium]|nr:glucosidase [Planctomycetota bacterium]